MVVTTDTGAVNQQFEFVPMGGGSQIALGGERNKIVSRCRGKAMDIPGGSPNNQVPIQQFRDQGGANRQFDVLRMGNGLFEIRSPLTGKVFDIPFGAAQDGLQLQQVADDGGSNQRFRIEFAN